MVAQNGQDVLIKLDTTGSREFQTVAGIRSNKLTLNAQTINITHSKSSGGWRELLNGGGVRTANISGSGVFLDTDCDALMRRAFFNGELLLLQFVLPDFGTMEGKFQINTLEYAGNYDGEMIFDLSFVSAGEILFTEHVAVEAPV